MAEEEPGAAGEKPAPIPTPAEAGGVTSYWRQTLWAMVAIQFVHTVAVGGVAGAGCGPITSVGCAFGSSIGTGSSTATG